MRFDDTNASAPATARPGPDDYLDILTERGQQSHQPGARKIGEVAIEQSRHLGLIDAHEAGRSHLVLSCADQSSLIDV